MRCTLIFSILIVYSQLLATQTWAQQNQASPQFRPARYARWQPTMPYSQQPYAQFSQNSQLPLNPQFPEPNCQNEMFIGQPSDGWEGQWDGPNSPWTPPVSGINEGNWTSPSGRSNNPGQYPFLFGNIFGITSDECCDEWAGHCRCLELTNLRSNCECTNPHRTKAAVPEHSLDSTNTSGARLNRTSDRKTISDYFHPRRFR